jgi:predicted DCC family thiol-disulfide oxidoreductase YuxK
MNDPMTKVRTEPDSEPHTEKGIEPEAELMTTPETQAMSKPTLYFDGGCPLCRREIDHYRRLDRSDRVRWIDLHQAADELNAVGLDTETAMRRIHLRAPDGRLISGVPAFVSLWDELPVYRLLARAVRALRLSAPLDWGYRHFADWRFRRRCRDGVCDTAPARRSR